MFFKVKSSITYIDYGKEITKELVDYIPFEDTPTFYNEQTYRGVMFYFRSFKNYNIEYEKENFFLFSSVYKKMVKSIFSLSNSSAIFFKKDFYII